MDNSRNDILHTVSLTTKDQEAAPHMSTFDKVEKQLLPDYLTQQKSVSQSQIFNPYLLTKELDAFYHVFVDRF